MTMSDFQTLSSSRLDVLVLAALAVWGAEARVLAYIDPGSGALIWQAIVAGFVGAGSTSVATSAASSRGIAARIRRPTTASGVCAVFACRRVVPRPGRRLFRTSDAIIRVIGPSGLADFEAFQVVEGRARVHRSAAGW